MLLDALLNAGESLGIGRGPARVIPHVDVDQRRAGLEGRVRGLNLFPGRDRDRRVVSLLRRDRVMATLMTVGRVTVPIIPQLGDGLQSGMLSESDTVLHSWCRQADWAAPTIVGGAGAQIHTADGRSILDMSSLAECCNLGHQHPKVVAAIREQAQKLCFVTSAWGAEPRARLAELLLEKSGFAGGRVFFTLGRRRCERERGEVRAAGVGQAARPHHRARPFLSRCELRDHGAVRRQSHAAPGRSRCIRVVHAPPPYAYRCPFGTLDRRRVRRPRAAHVGELIDKQRTWSRSSWSRTPERTASSRA
jgi:hypothetical protein